MPISAGLREDIVVYGGFIGQQYIFLLNKLCHVDHKRMIQHIIFLANRIVKKQNNMSEFRDMMEAIEKLIKKLMHNDRE